VSIYKVSILYKASMFNKNYQLFFHGTI